MAHARRLYHVDPVWGHTVAGYVTDYVIFTAALVCAMGAFIRLRTAPALAEQGRSVLVNFIIYACFSGVSFFAGGIAHNMIDSYGNGPLGKTWGSQNSGWMYPWTVAVATQPTAVMASIALVFTVAAFPAWSKYLCYFLGVVAGIIELVSVSPRMWTTAGLRPPFWRSLRTSPAASWPQAWRCARSAKG